MSRAKVTDTDFIDSLIATPLQATAAEAQRTQPPRLAGPGEQAAHDAYTRLLHRLETDAEALWAEVRSEVRPGSGVLVLDDSVLDEPHACKMDLVHHQWLGWHHGVVKGIALLTLLWTGGDRHVPYDEPLVGPAFKQLAACRRQIRTCHGAPVLSLG